MNSDDNLLLTCVIFLIAAVIALPISKRLGLGSVLGYLMAGIAIGPWGLGLITQVDDILHFSELGVVLLLFLIGLELNPAKLWKMKNTIMGLGGAQVAFSSIAISGMAFGISGALSLDFSLAKSVVIGLGLALSSTAIALKIIDEQKLTHKETGQSSFAILLFQDIAVIPILACLPLLTGSTDLSVGHALSVFTTIATLLIGGHFLLKPLFRMAMLIGGQELFTLVSLLVVMGISWLMQSVGLSMALGSFLAGVLLAESEYRHEIETSIQPFKGLLLGLFFIAVGMTVNIDLLFSHTRFILVAVIGLIALKSLIIILVGRLAKIPSKSSMQMAVLLSQGGEFAFVIFTAAFHQGIFSQEELAFALVVVSVSMLVTPLLLKGQNLWRGQRLNASPKAFDSKNSKIKNTKPKVIIAGFGRFGQVVGRLLYANKISLTILESDPIQVKLLRKYGYNVFFGDASRHDLLVAAGAESATAIVLCHDDPELVLQTAIMCQRRFPHLKILARARSRVEAYELMNHGIDDHARETFASGLLLGKKTLIQLGMHPYKAERAAAYFDKLDNQMLEELLPLHSDDKQLIERAKEARIELEEIFARELDEENQPTTHWD